MNSKLLNKPKDLSKAMLKFKAAVGNALSGN